jgi:hypothetical protein
MSPSAMWLGVAYTTAEPLPSVVAQFSDLNYENKDWLTKPLLRAPGSAEFDADDHTDCFSLAARLGPANDAVIGPSTPQGQIAIEEDLVAVILGLPFP